MRHKKAGIFMAAALAAMSLAGCGAFGEPEDYATNEGYQTKESVSGPETQAQEAALDETADTNQNALSAGEAAEEGKSITKENIKIGVLYITDPAEGSGYSYMHDLGILSMQDNLGIEDEQIERKIVDENDEEATKAAIEECVSDGCQVIFTTSFNYMEPTSEMAEKYPDVYFSHGTGYLSNGANFNNYFGRIYQARYLSGIVAGMNTKSNKIGYVAAQDNSNAEVTGGIDAFALGVESVNPDAKIYVEVTYSWYDPAAEEAASKKLLDMGCDVMAQHCDTPYPLTLAEEYGVYGIGYNSDMSKEAPDACLCSVIWNWGAYYTAAVNDVLNGTWTGENYYGGMAEGLVGITDLADFCAEGTAEKVEEAKSAILSGDFNVFDGEMETNTGDIIGSKGSTLEDAQITGAIDWYYRNVEVVD